jgi:hypothetical protein
VDSRAQELILLGDSLFTKRLPILSLWQAIAEQFNPMRADYTTTRSMGMEFFSHLMTGLPSMASRDLANAISAMLRPPGQTWFHARTQTETVNRDQGAKIWLDWASEIMRQAMYDSRSGWSRSAKEADRDFVTIGNACLSLRPNRNMDGLLYRAKHMRDVAWAEGPDGGIINNIHIKWPISKRNLKVLFPKTASLKIDDAKDPFGMVNCRHIVMPSDEYDSVDARYERAPGDERKKSRRKLPFTSIWIDTDHQVVLEEIGQWQLGYIPPRWDLTAGFDYGYSPTAAVGISDARMLQQITLTLLEAGQKAVDPPYKAVSEAIQGGINTFAGGVTWVDNEYDERSGAALEPLLGGSPNLGWGVDREKRISDILSRGHFLDQIRLPDSSHARTAFEVQKLWEEFIRTTTPLFEPLQSEYNGAVCDQTFEMMLRMNAFGSAADMPQVLRGQNIRFIFDSPLTVAATRANAQAFTQVGQLMQLGMAIDPNIKEDFDVDTAFRDAVDGSGAPARWLVPQEKADAKKAALRQQQAQQQALQQSIATADQGATAATKIGAAATQLQQGGLLPQRQPQTGGSI